MQSRFPEWLKQEFPDAKILSALRLLAESKINTVCQEARCPNIMSCFKSAKLTFMILGDTCTRNCKFCAVKKGICLPIDNSEVGKVTKEVLRLGLRYVVITSVTRDDLSDGGAGQFANVIKAIKSIDKNIRIEVLIPDFQGKYQSLKRVVSASPSVIAHNIETVRRLYAALRPKANYEVSLMILDSIKEYRIDLLTKSSIMLGLGETEEEIVTAMQDLRKSRCDILTLGQYLAPSPKHYPVKEFISPEQFSRYRDVGLSLGFKNVFSGPLVRSSYQAEEVYNACMT